jgi:hypothetical protein
MNWYKKAQQQIEYAIIDSTGYIFKRSIRDTIEQVKNQALYTTGHKWDECERLGYSIIKLVNRIPVERD